MSIAPTVAPTGTLIGRDGELAVLGRLVAEVARGRGASVLIEGEPGIRKSALVRAALADAAAASCQVFSAPAPGRSGAGRAIKRVRKYAGPRQGA